MSRRLAVLALLLAASCSTDRDDPAPVGAQAQVNAPALDAPAPVTHGDDRLPPRPPGLAARSAPEHPWPCEGAGDDGRRVQLLYVHGGGGSLAANRASFESIARRIEGTFLASAREGGGERLVRFVTGAGCSLSIVDRTVSASALASFDAMINELAAQGFNRRDRIYHAWVEGSAYCGIGTVYIDDRVTGNDNEAYAQYSRSDRQCWDYAEAHEITHNLGGVQNSAPNSTGGLHSRDEYDVMSYPDGAPNGQMIQPYPCPDVAAEDLLDCRDDDYFSANPPGGSYLATHWNVAGASALSRSAGTTSSTSSTTSTSSTSTSTTSTSVGQGRTVTDLSAPSSVRNGVPFQVRVTVTGSCGPEGTVSILVSDRLVSRQVLSAGSATVTLTLNTTVSRPTIRATYGGSSRCATSTDTARPRVVR